ADESTALAKIDHGRCDLRLGHAQSINRAVHLLSGGAIAKRVAAEMVGALGNRSGNFGSAIYLRTVECRCAEDMVKMIVRQHDMADLAASHLPHILGDRP